MKKSFHIFCPLPRYVYIEIPFNRLNRQSCPDQETTSTLLTVFTTLTGASKMKQTKNQKLPILIAALYSLITYHCSPVSNYTVPSDPEPKSRRSRPKSEPFHVFFRAVPKEFQILFQVCFFFCSRFFCLLLLKLLS